MRHYLRHAFFGAAAFLSITATLAAQPRSSAMPAEQKAVADATFPFGADILQELVRAEPGRNLFISPFSISMALGMTLNGARGPAIDAIAGVMHLKGVPSDAIGRGNQGLAAALAGADSGVVMQSGNSIWYAHGFGIDQSFQKSVSGPYGAEIYTVDFASSATADSINRWVSDRTRGKIPGILEGAPGDAVQMMLINAIYFKGSWARKFDEKATRDETFTTGAGRAVTCRMMRRLDTYEYFNDPLVEGVDIPYGDGRFSMTVLLPRPGKSVDAVVEALQKGSWKEWRKRFYPVEMDLGLPRFKMEYRVELLDHLETLGMRLMNPGADLQGLGGGGRNLMISSVLHKTFVEVNEEGTEAAAVTAVTVITDSAPENRAPLPFIVNRPAIFLIRDRSSGTVAFIGKLSDPG